MYSEKFLWRIVRVVTASYFLITLLIVGSSVCMAEAGGVFAGHDASKTASAAESTGLFGHDVGLFHLVIVLLLFATVIVLICCLRTMVTFASKKAAHSEKKVQEALKLYTLQQTEYDAVLDTVSDLVIFLDPDQKITWLNRRAESVFGVEYSTVIGRSCHEIWHTLIGDGFLCPGRKCLFTGVTEQSIGWTRDKKQFDIRAVPVRDRCGNIVRIIEIGRDITESSRLEQKLRHVQKMESLGWLATGITHDFNNILTGIVGFAYLLQKKVSTDGQSGTYCAHITTAAERAEMLTQTFLAFTRSQSVSMAVDDLNDILRSAEDLIARVLGEDVELCLRLADDQIPVLADRLLFGQVLLNIAVHCRSAMVTGDKFVVTTSTTSLPERDLGGAAGLSSQYVCLEIEVPLRPASGRSRNILLEGVPAADRFGEGVNLGLAVARGIVELHGGSISLVEGRAGGAVFTILLPLSRKAGLEFQGGEPSPALSGDNETILLVEDDKWTRSFLREFFEGFGYGIIEAEDATDAMEKFRCYSSSIALVLCDMILPKMSGRELCRELASISPELKVLFMSGYPGDVIRSRGIAIDDITILSKPFKPEQLLQAVRVVLQGSG